MGHIENLKGEVREALTEASIHDDPLPELLEIEFSSDQRATLEEKIDSYYISQLLKDIKDEKSKQKFNEIIKNKAPHCQSGLRGGFRIACGRSENCQ